MQQVEVVGNNLANINTPAFSRHIYIASQQTDGASGSQPDLSPGTLLSTNRALDVALPGGSLLKLLGHAGAVYTRNGRLFLDAQGQLVSAQGLPVSVGGSPVNLPSSEVRIDSDGTIWSGQDRFGQLELVENTTANSLRVVGAGLFASDFPLPVSSTVSGVRQGMLENSNVDAAYEMVKLMATMRQMEASQKIIQAYDGMMSEALSNLGQF